MMKTKREKVLALGIVGLLVLGFLMCCSGIQFPFINARSSLNGHLSSDFGVALPSSMVVTESYWVGARDPENVYQTQMTPADILPFVDKLRAAAKTKGYEESAELEVRHFGPLYRVPTWWNNPPLADGVPLGISIKRDGMVTHHYRFLYSPSVGTMYVVWGGF